MKSQKSCWAASLTALMLLTVLLSWEFVSYIRGDDRRSSGKDSGSSSSSDVRSREKRFLFFTAERRLSFPIGTSLTLVAYLTMPAARNLPEGYAADMTLENVVSIFLDDLGLTSDENPWFMVPYFYNSDDERGSYPGVSFAGGDRLVMFQVIEDLMLSIGLLGKPCMLRAICEMFEVPFTNHGFVGELLKLFFSVSSSPYAEERLEDYLAAERSGKELGDCSGYYTPCLHSLFSNTSKQHQPKLIQVVSEEEEQSSRQKRFVYLTTERRLTFPPNSAFIFSPVISIPFRGYSPQGINGLNLQVAPLFNVLFDDLGLTSEENPFGILPFLDDTPRRKRSTVTRKSDPKYPGGDRDMLYNIVEDTLKNLGFNGKACLLRAICEMFQYPLDNHGFLGEVLELFFSASLSTEADKRLPQYLAAERAGRTTGKCLAYHESCPTSFFSNPMDSHLMEDNDLENDVPNKSRQGNAETKHSLFKSLTMLTKLFEFVESWL